MRSVKVSMKKREKDSEAIFLVTSEERSGNVYQSTLYVPIVNSILEFDQSRVNSHETDCTHEQLRAICQAAFENSLVSEPY